MKDEKLIYAVRNIDDDLICEAMKRRSTDTEPIGEAVRAVYVAEKRKGQVWKYSAAVAALLAVTGGTIFIVQYQDGIKNQLDFPGYTNESEGQTEGDVGTAGTEVSSLAVVTEPVEAAPVVPTKEMFFRGDLIVYLDSYPEIPQHDFDEKFFTPMTTMELLMYYDYDEKVATLFEDGVISEVTDENTHHGIYKLPDGSVYDVNTFTFKTCKDDSERANRFTVTLSKETKFGQEYYEYRNDKKREDIYPTRSFMFCNEETNTLFTVHKLNGEILMVSASYDEITDVDNPTLKAYFEERAKEALPEGHCSVVGLSECFYHTRYLMTLYYSYVKVSDDEWGDKREIEPYLFEED